MQCVTDHGGIHKPSRVPHSRPTQQQPTKATQQQQGNTPPARGLSTTNTCHRPGRNRLAASSTSTQQDSRQHKKLRRQQPSKDNHNQHQQHQPQQHPPRLQLRSHHHQLKRLQPQHKWRPPSNRQQCPLQKPTRSPPIQGPAMHNQVLQQQEVSQTPSLHNHPSQNQRLSQECLPQLQNSRALACRKSPQPARTGREDGDHRQLKHNNNNNNNSRAASLLHTEVCKPTAATCKQHLQNSHPQSPATTRAMTDSCSPHRRNSQHTTQKQHPLHHRHHNHPQNHGPQQEPHASSPIESNNS